jgi:hypothetical protein
LEEEEELINQLLLEVTLPQELINDRKPLPEGEGNLKSDDPSTLRYKGGSFRISL